MRFTAVALLLAAAPAAALLLQNGGDDAMRVWSAAGMRPEVAARMLGEVELKWVHGELSVLMGDVSQESVQEESLASCGKLVKAIAQGSGGDPARVTEYMEDVCEQSIPAGYDDKLCIAFANGCAGAMTDDVEYNRNSLNTTAFCATFMNGAITDAAKKWQEVAEDEEEKKINATSLAPVATTEVTQVASTTDAPVAAATEATAAASIIAPAEQDTAANATDVDAAADVTDVDADTDSLDEDSSADNATQQVNATNATEDISATLAKLKESQALRAKVHRHRAHLAAGRHAAAQRVQNAKMASGGV